MKITLLIGCLTGGGAERVVCNLANHLAAHNHDVDVLIVANDITYKPNSNVNVISMSGESGTYFVPKTIINLWRLYKFNRYLRNQKRDLYVTFLPKLSIMLMQQGRFFKAPVVLAERSNPEKFCSRSKENDTNFLKYYSKADGYVFQTDDARSYYDKRGLNVSNSAVIPNAINEAFVLEPYTGEREKVIVSVGRLTKEKNFHILISAFAKIAPKFPEYKLRFYGQGKMLETLQELTKTLGIVNRVEFAGYVHNVSEVLRKTSLFVLSSEFEGMPNALSEAMALGLPCIATDCPVGGPRFLIEEEVNGLLVPVGDVDSMADAIERVLNNEELKEKLGQNARHISERLSSDKIYNMWEEFLVRTANNKK